MEKEEMAQIGRQLRAARLRGGYSQGEAAQAAGVSRQTVGNWEAGRNLPNLIQFRRLVSLYVVSAYQMLFGEPLVEVSPEEAAELARASENFSPSLRARIELWLAVVARRKR